MDERFDRCRDDYGKRQEKKKNIIFKFTEYFRRIARRPSKCEHKLHNVSELRKPDNKRSCKKLQRVEQYEPKQKKK